MPATPLRTRSGSESYDDYGNLTESTATTVSGTSFEVSAIYDNFPSDWLIGLLRQRAVSTQEASKGAAPRTFTRTMNYDYDANGRLEFIYREKNNADTTLFRKTELKFDNYGVLTKFVNSVVANPAIPARETRIEYAPLWPNQPDERIFPSQMWQPFTPLQYRPSEWTAYHPAYGVLSATMDVNGVNTQSIYDELGRLVTAYPPGAPHP